MEAIVSAPAEAFAEVKPLLYAIANSLQPTPQWHYASQDVLVQIQNARHAANMQIIHDWGQAILKAGREYSKISDERMAQWKKDQAVDDEKQRDRVRRIYDIYTHTTASGKKVGVPLGHKHLYDDGKGGFQSSENPIANAREQGLTPVEHQ
jgi:hypothetical protein